MDRGARSERSRFQAGTVVGRCFYSRVRRRNEYPKLAQSDLPSRVRDHSGKLPQSPPLESALPHDRWKRAVAARDRCHIAAGQYSNRDFFDSHHEERRWNLHTGFEARAVKIYQYCRSSNPDAAVFGAAESELRCCGLQRRQKHRDSATRVRNERKAAYAVQSETVEPTWTVGPQLRFKLLRYWIPRHVGGNTRAISSNGDPRRLYRRQHWRVV